MKKMQKITCAVLAVMMMVSLLCACGSNKNDGYTGKNTEFVIGATAPLTGEAAIYGKAVQNAAQMAVEEINAAGGLNGTKFKLMILDDKHDGSTIATNFANLLEAGMQVSLGTVTSGPALEFKTYAKDENVFFLTPSASNDKVPEFENGYQMCFADGNQGMVAANFVNQTCAGKTIGVFYKADEDYSKGIFNQFKSNLDASVKTIETSFNASTSTDFTNQIDTLKNCDFIFMPIYYQPASLFMDQAKGVIADDAVFYGCDGFDGLASMDGFDINSIPQEISMLSQFNSKATEGAPAEFISKYVAKYGDATLNQFAASAYDCVYAIYNAMKAAADKDSKSISVTMSASDLCEVLKAQFSGGFTTSGVTGETISWDANGFVNKVAVKYTLKDAN